MELDDVIDDVDYSLTQRIALAALNRGVQGLLVPAASLVTANLVILTDSLSPSAVIRPLDSINPRLFVPRP